MLLASSKAKVVGGFTFIALRCSSRLACQGQFFVHIKARVGKRHKLRTVLCTATSLKLRAHQQKQVKARISGICVAILRHARGQQIIGQFTSHLRTGQLGITRRIKLTL